MNKKLVMLAILDGYGITDIKEGNAIYKAKTPVMDMLRKEYPNTIIGASGEDVGLPDGQMGNSEVGHMNIGAGRIVWQSLTRVNVAVRKDELIKNEAIQKAINNAKKNNCKVHIMGLCSDGGVHSHINHILYLLEKTVKSGVKETVVHCFLDGRDVPPTSAMEYLSQVEDKCKEVGNSKIGVVSGRYYAMDRDKNYDRVKKAYDALVYNEAPVKEVATGIKESYEAGVTDEFVVPFLANGNSNINDGDSVIFCNFRPDRAIEISTALTNPKATLMPEAFKEFKDLTYVCMMLYSENVKGDIAFGVQKLDNIYGDVISKAGLKQLRIAETEKYAHVTFFFDGGVDKELPGEDRILVDSPKEVKGLYNLKPEMSAYEVCDKVVKAIESEKYDTIILNFANCDMVGHTTVMDATIKAVEVVDECLGRVYEAVKKVNGELIVTADHGNAEKLLDEEGKPFSAHTTNPVPLIICNKNVTLKEGGSLGDITPTMLQLLGIDQPEEMTGTSMIKKFN